MVQLATAEDLAHEVSNRIKDCVDMGEQYWITVSQDDRAFDELDSPGSSGFSGVSEATARWCRLSGLSGPGAGLVLWRALHEAEGWWNDLERYQTYAALRYAFQDRINDASEVAVAMFWSVATQNRTRAERLLALANRRLHRGVVAGVTPWAPPRRHSDPGASVTYAAWLVARWLGVEHNYPVRGVYAEMQANWSGDLTGTLAAVSDYHLTNADLGGTDAFFGMFQLFPVEIEATAVVRAQERLSTPDVEHPLTRNRAALAYAKRGASTYDPHTDALLRATVHAMEREGLVTPELDPYSV